MLAALFMLFLAAPIAHAQTASPPAQEIPLTAPATPAAHQTPLAACTALARPGDTPAALFRLPPGRFRCDGALLPKPHSLNSYWLLLRPAHAGDSLQGPLLSFRRLWQRSATLTVRRADGTLATLRLDNATLPAYTRIGGQTVVPIPGAVAGAAPVTGLLLHVVDVVPLYLTIRDVALVDAAAADRTERDETAFYDLFYGACITLVVSNLLLWLFVREPFQLAFCTSLLLMVAWVWEKSGGIAVAFPWLDATLPDRLMWITRGLSAAAWLLLWDRVLEPGSVAPRLRRATHIQVATMEIAALATTLAPLDWADTAATVFLSLYLLFYLFQVALVWNALCRSSPAVRIVLVVLAAPMAFGLFRIVQVAMGQTLSDEHGLVGWLTCHALMATLVIALRLRRIITERDAARADERVARRLADIDPLTGLLNRRALLARVLAQPQSDPQRLLLVDVDHFKAINDAHGHDAGDAVLRELATLLGRRTRGRYHVGRLGGEEFALIGPAEDLGGGLALGILADVRTHLFTGGHRVTVSIGMAEGPVTGETDWTELYRRADSALYIAKGTGRNRVVDLPPDAVPEPQRPRVTRMAGLFGT